MPYAGHPDFDFVYGDFTDRALIGDLADDATDVVILGGLVGDPITKKYPEQATHINLDGVKAVLGALDGRGLNRVVFISPPARTTERSATTRPRTKTIR